MQVHACRCVTAAAGGRQRRRVRLGGQRGNGVCRHAHCLDSTRRGGRCLRARVRLVPARHHHDGRRRQFWVMLGVAAALVVASVLCLVAGLLKPQRPMSLKLSLIGGPIWIACALDRRRYRASSRKCSEAEPACQARSSTIPEQPPNASFAGLSWRCPLESALAYYPSSCGTRA